MPASTKIAIIEDEVAIAQMYAFKLSKLGYDVRMAYNGEDGLTLCVTYRPDLILLDLRMPVMDGAEMLKRLRATEWGSGIRVIILTNISRQEAPSSLQFLNVDRYIVKAHYTPQQVVDIVGEVLG